MVALSWINAITGVHFIDRWKHDTSSKKLWGRKKKQEAQLSQRDRAMRRVN